MKRILSAFLCALLLCLALTVTAFADYDEIVSYDLVVTPNAEDGSLSITATLDWKALEALDYGEELKIGIPNGSIREETALTDNIERLDYDNSYMYVYLNSGIKRNEVVHFSYSWVQEYMYTLSDNGGVSYDYTPGWFDDIRIDHMSVTWNDPAGVSGNVSASGSGGSWQQSGQSWQADNLGYSAKLNVAAVYPNWPTELYWENSAENYNSGWDDGWDDTYYDDYDDDADALLGLVVFIFIIIVICMVIAAKRSRSSYVGGFGSAYVHPTYVYVGGLWYPAGPDHKPRPGSVGLAHKPPTPTPRPKSSSSSSGGFGGGSRGGGFGSSGFGGGSRGCACASSCACACACACAGGGRAGCSAKNLYGAVRLNKELTKNLKH